MSAPASSTTRRTVLSRPRSTVSAWPGCWAAPDVQRVLASSSTAFAASPGLAVALTRIPWKSSNAGPCGPRLPGHVNVASAPPGSVYSNDWSPSWTANERGASFSLCTTSAVEPSGLRKATSMICPFQPVVPNEELAMRVAPGATKRARWPRVKYSAFWVTVWPGPTVTTPLQVSQPFSCGPPDGSSARFQFTTEDAQLRVTPITTLRACHFSVSENTCAGGSLAPCEPEHSVNQMPFCGNASCNCVMRR